MSDPTPLLNLAAYSVQVALVAAAGGLLHSLLRVTTPGVSYAYWRILLLVCLLLPWVQGRAPAAAVSVGVTEASLALPSIPAAGPEATGTSRRPDPLAAIGLILLFGIVLRAGRVGFSVARLHRLRSAGRGATEADAFDELQQQLGVRTAIRYVDDISMPVTFGAWKPVILLPGAMSRQPESIQRAAVAHELLHVQRRDWLWHMAEEAVVTLLWFNPAIWWVVGRIRFTREATVDELTVLATGKRRTYIQALLAFAEGSPMSPVTAFAGRRSLFLRIQSLSKEAVMSSRRVVVVAGVFVVGIGAAAGYAIERFPMRAGSEPQQVSTAGPGPLERRAVPLGAENPVPQRTNFEAPITPVEGRAANAQGNVTLMITLDELGRVAEVRRTAISLSAPSIPSFRSSGTSAGDDEAMLAKAPPEYAGTLRTLASAYTDAAVRAVSQWRYEPPAAAPIAFPVVFTFAADGEARAVAMTQGSAGVQRALSEMPDNAVRVGGNIKPPQKIQHVDPVYPPIAKSANVAGMVIVETLVGPDGSVQKARVLRSIPLLDQAALDAVTQWRFTPTLLNGVPVPVIMTVTVNFTPQRDGGGEISSSTK